VPVEFRILGAVELRRDGRVVPLGGPKQQVFLVALLLRANQQCLLDWLVEALWDGEEPPASAEANIRTHASALRRALVGADDVRLVAERRGYRLQVLPDAVDAAVFSRQVVHGQEALSRGALDVAVGALEEALALWHGRAAAGLPCPRILTGHLALLEDQRQAAAEDLAEARLARGEHAAAVAGLRALVAEHPFRERAWGQLMLALYQSGDPAAALDAFATARATLVDQLGMEPGVELRKLQRAILTRDPSIARGEPPHDGRRRAVPADTSGHGAAAAVPRQLPPGPAHLVGHVRALAAVRAGLEAGGSRSATVAVHGAAGVGKSALVLHAAHAESGRFPDGQLYVDLAADRPAGASPTATAALASLLGALGVPEGDVPSSRGAAAATLRSIVAGRRVLVVLDNATDERALRPLLPAGGGCATLISSRRMLGALDDVTHVPLGVLPVADSIALLGQLAGAGRVAAEPEAAAQIAQACGHLPLALRIAGARLATRPGWPLRQLAERLADEHRRLDELHYGDLSVRRSIRSSYDPLRAADPVAARVFRLLGRLRGEQVCPAETAARLGIPLPLAESALERLTDVRLLESPAPGRYRIEALLRLFAAERACREEAPAEPRRPPRRPSSPAEGSRRATTPTTPSAVT
jgi:DNA-binding SARP family transcriptional activator